MALKFNPLTGQMEDDVMDAANLVAPAQPFQPESTQPMNPMVRDYLTKKFDLGQYSDENRQKLLADQGLGFGDKAGAALAAIGAGFMGKDAGAAGQAKLNAAKAEKRQALADFDAGRKNTIEGFDLDRKATSAAREDQAFADAKDPNSERSKAAQRMLVEDLGMDPKIASQLSAEQAEARIPTLTKKLDREMREREFSERQKDRNLQREIAMGQKDLARQDKLDKEAKLSDKQIESISSYDKALDSIKSIRAGKSQYDTGPLAGRTNAVAGVLGVDDAGKSAFRAEVQDQLAQYIKSISGGAVSDSERASLLQNLPNMNDNDETFNKKLDALEKRLAGHRQTDIDNYRKGGKNVKEFDTRAPQQETKVIGGKTYRKVDGGWEEVE